MVDAEETLCKETLLGLRIQMHWDHVQFDAWVIFREKNGIPHHIRVRFYTFLCEEQNVMIELYKAFMHRDSLFYGQSLIIWGKEKAALCKLV